MDGELPEWSLGCPECHSELLSEWRLECPECHSELKIIDYKFVCENCGYGVVELLEKESPWDRMQWIQKETVDGRNEMINKYIKNQMSELTIEN